jgi:hypothetical protein
MKKVKCKTEREATLIFVSLFCLMILFTSKYAGKIESGGTIESKTLDTKSIDWLTFNKFNFIGIKAIYD